ncbi:alpha/beta hydrolase [Pedobacter cryotolerans]|uniref:Alpha/beta hydrolase n=1 Tax=Pedobacter cryotolerans TaxID=2571270 RepID=A0A4U1CEX4_9SPHI|nr:alpha/beta hydrolase [Pedobacter cryotolerans]TKC03420.1 alpha/beta hydrolase [Pedobacter cryotolerans]
MKRLLIIASLLFTIVSIKAQDVIPLYKGVIPGSKTAPANFKENTVTGSDGVARVSRVAEPTLTVFAPAKPNGTAVIICPGGGYSILAIGKEGYDVAKKFAEIGVTAFVLKYRLPNDTIMVDKKLAPLQDALQAMYLVRKNASVWNLQPNKIGIMGFSAGGHLASSLSVHYNDMKIENQEDISLRPDFSILIYPVISFGTVTHAGSVKRLLGDDPAQAQKTYFSNQNHINAQTPPAFLVHANNDLTVPVKNSLMYNENLAKFKVPAEMHIYQSGGHGFGLNNKTTTENWFNTLKAWMTANRWL